MSPHTFPAICYGITKNIAERLPLSKYNELLETRIQLKKQFEVNSIHIFKLQVKLKYFFILKYFIVKYFK